MVSWIRTLIYWILSRGSWPHFTILRDAITQFKEHTNMQAKKKREPRIIDKKTQLKKSDPSLDHKAIMLATLCEINWIRSNLILMEIICILATSFRFVRSLGIHRTSTSWEESFTLTDLWKLTYTPTPLKEKKKTFFFHQKIVFTQSLKGKKHV